MLFLLQGCVYTTDLVYAYFALSIEMYTRSVIFCIVLLIFKLNCRAINALGTWHCLPHFVCHTLCSLAMAYYQFIYCLISGAKLSNPKILQKTD